MPLNAKGTKIKAAMKSRYGHKEGEKTFHLGERKGSIKGILKKKLKK